MKKWLVLLVFPMACNYYQAYEPAIHGLASPIQLSPEKTAVWLSDYFPKAWDALDSVRWPAGLQALESDSGVVWLTGIPSTRISTAHFYQKGIRYDIPVIASAKRPVKWIVEGLKLKEDKVNIFGTFNAWNREALTMQKEAEGRYSALLYLQAGTYEYKLWADGLEWIDPSNPDSLSNGIGGFNSILRIEAEGIEPEMVYPISHGKNFVSLSAIPENQEIVAFWENHSIEARASFEGGKVVYNLPIPNPAFRVGRSHIRVYSSSNGQLGNDLLIPLERGQVVEKTEDLNRSDWHIAQMYFLMIDRFSNGNKENDREVKDSTIHPKANYYGGDISGVIDQMQAGYFDSLNMNTIWISPISKNPEDAWGLWDKGGVKTKFSGYHGYWPISNVVPDSRFATEKELRYFLDKAHERNNNVLLDYVANHVHQEHPIYKQHPEWATPLYLPDGSLNTERWDDHRLTTWFDTFMPTLDLRKQEIVDPMTDSALVWVTKYDFDGYRHDATKHISERFWRTLTAKVKDTLPEKHIYQIGETYGSPELIASYLGSGMMDAQFDFNVYDASVSAFSGVEPPNQSLHRLVEVFNTSLKYYGHHNLMGYISGNQDRSRFISIASGDVLLSEDQKLKGWTQDIPYPNDQAFDRLALLHAFNFSIPGIPVVYYGDEIGLHGAGDPDNRKMMRFENLSAQEKGLKKKLSKLALLRSSHMAMTYGTTELNVLEEGVLLIKRSYFEQTVYIVLNVTKTEKQITLPKESFEKHFSGDWSSETGILNLPPLQFEILTLN